MDRDTLAVEVRRRRLAAGMTLRELGERSGVDYSLIGRIEKGARNVTIDTVQKLLSVLEDAPDPNAHLVARFAALLPSLGDGERAALLQLISLFESQHRPRE